MILLWNNYAREYKLWTNLRGIRYNSTRPNTVILTKKEYDELTNNPYSLMDEKGKEYLNDVLSRITTVPNVIVAV